VIVIEPTLMSHRPAQLPAVINVQSGVKLDPKFFEIDYAEVSDKNQAQGQR